MSRATARGLTWKSRLLEGADTFLAPLKGAKKGSDPSKKLNFHDKPLAMARVMDSPKRKTLSPAQYKPVVHW